jgi:hypothetical protein
MENTTGKTSKTNKDCQPPRQRHNPYNLFLILILLINSFGISNNIKKLKSRNSNEEVKKK